MPFPVPVMEDALFRSRRCCAICHCFAGLYANVHHIVPEAEGGSAEVQNAVVLCDRCNAEIVAGRYTPEEVRRFRDEWWTYIDANPAVSLPTEPLSVGPGRVDLPRTEGEASRYEIHLNNSSSRPFYDVAVAVTMSDATDNYSVELGQITPDPGQMVDTGGAQVDFGTLRLEVVDPLGRPAHWIYVRTVNPQTLYQLPITVRATRAAMDGNISAVSMLMSMSREQTRLIERPSEVEAGATEYLVRVPIYGEFYWLGLIASPVSQTPGA